MNKYFKMPKNQGDRLPAKLEEFMLMNLEGKMTSNRQLDFLHKGIAMAYSNGNDISWGQKMDGYECTTCGKRFINSWAYGPICPDNMKIGYGCTNIGKIKKNAFSWTPLGELESLAMFARELPCVIVNRAKKIGKDAIKIGTHVIEQAGDVVNKAIKISDNIIDTALHTREEVKKKSIEFLGRTRKP